MKDEKGDYQLTMENYSRKIKLQLLKKKTPTRHHIKGLCFSEDLATIGEYPGIITATITIMTFMNKSG